MYDMGDVNEALIAEERKARLSSLDRMVRRLGELAHREHYSCEDGWYSCPLSTDGCFNDNYPKDECNCGATNHNAEVDKLSSAVAAILAPNASISDRTNCVPSSGNATMNHKEFSSKGGKASGGEKVKPKE